MQINRVHIRLGDNDFWQEIETTGKLLVTAFELNRENFNDTDTFFEILDNCLRLAFSIHSGWDHDYFAKKIRKYTKFNEEAEKAYVDGVYGANAEDLYVVFDHFGEFSDFYLQ